DADSPGVTEPALGTIGGTWDEAFNLPVDPDLLLQRTGYACMDEFEYPPGSVFEENTWYFYDDTCKVGSDWCHETQHPSESCVEAIQKHSGIVKTAVHFTRVAYDRAIADSYRVGEITNPDGADLAVVREGLEDERAIVYKWFEAGSCELEEGVIAKLGWRRLMRFSAIVQNNGTEAVHIGDVTDPSNPWITSHVFEFSPCHGHYHFSHYGTFDYNGAPGSKRAFCLEDTNRFHNDETTPLTAAHQSCEFQGIGAGWGDEYEFGIPGQWVDVTDVDTKRPHDLTFDSNPDAFMCEGQPVLDAAGQPIFDPTSFTDAQGDVVSRMRCDMPSTWHDDNVGATAVSSPGGSFVTEACKLGQIGPRRDCGFSAQKTLRSCTPGATVNLTCTSTGPAQVLRICEKSAALGVGVACTLADAAANTVVAGSTPVSFTCPAVRDGNGTGGYSVYQASVLPSQGAGAVTCTGW
ncbi:MAG TPA: lysyl oxidase family protein, partial [Kofleriaceae bacterium]|nr:lysyl oxidase family protein [Kofleriaceae bacterium]